MSSEALERPRQVSLGWDSDGATSRDDAEQDRGSVCSLSAASEEHVESELGDVLKLPLRWRVVDRDQRIVDEAEERLAVIPVIPHGNSEWFRW